MNDSLDYVKFVEEIGMTEEQVQRLVHQHDDLIMTRRCFEYAVLKPSPIHGVGLFASRFIPKATPFAPARVNNCRCVAGRWMNHTINPNCQFVPINSDLETVALRDILEGEELTVNYRNILEIRRKTGI